MINKDKLMGYIAGLTTAILLCSSVAFAESIEKTLTAVYNNIKIMVDGTEVTPKDENGNVVEPFIVDGTTYLPVRALANALGQEVGWDGDTNTVYIGEVPEKEEPVQDGDAKYTVNNDILNDFSELSLMNIGANDVKGSFFNLYVATTANDDYFQYRCDNYSPDGTLQTMTIASEKAAKVLTEDIADMYHTLFAVYNAADKAGYLGEEAAKTEIEYQWTQFCRQFASDDELNEFLSTHSISAEDFKNYFELYTVYTMYSGKLYDEHALKDYTDSEVAAVADKEYVKVKHILVEDEATAKQLISKLKKGGTSFDKLVAEYSTDPGQGEDGYTFTKGEMVKEFEDASFALGKNSYTQTPVKSAYGYHIIYRYPLSTDWISANADMLRQLAAATAYNNEINSMLEDTKISYTQNYEKYISTIE